jgi:hypothetical protein
MIPHREPELNKLFVGHNTSRMLMKGPNHQPDLV